MVTTHSPGFLAIVNDARTRIKEVQADQVPAILKKSPIKLVDTREETEYVAGHVRGAEWLGKGIIERDIEAKHPDKHTPLYLYCGGGFRSALAADNLQKMGYTQVYSIDGGWRVLKEIMPIEKGV